ncbi:hypothetical protein Q9Q75_14640 [Mycobacterium intracellulare]|uniref:CDGP domain-containing protein n=1 Tax=Mycobacterium intracellulare TaxID=1767 RepID=A0AAE4RD60_MYCIT|nr:hypothetical protein [Mycobacterium intracellulare]MCA2319759.1 hypothetical protein [Mycobacterium intracellulare]MCA2340305.1 hypothetical protein [Mycobacterium intracellulare]MDV6978597.1 hypothetical protein [Mycobacterium intracellulare]MDV6983868.1 hypothetical protein [Mycobacterium intracellulare]MDV7013550.1 hypothetical protein [Mycobacterium intracellulare]
MKRGIGSGVAALLMAAGLIAFAPPAAAGCQYGGGVLSKCDGPVQPDGTWQRCVAVTRLIPHGASSYLVPEQNCDVMGPDQRPPDFAFADPPTHID